MSILKFKGYGIPEKITKKFLDDKDNEQILAIEKDFEGRTFYDYRFYEGKISLMFHYYPNHDFVTNVYLRDKEGDIGFNKIYYPKFVNDIAEEFSDGVFNLDEINKMEEFYRK
jgi:hypothetical protein